jgi:hypothetical protein
VAIEFVFMTCAIKALENREVAVIDLLGAFLFLHADCEDYVLMSCQGRLVELMVMAASETYRKYVKTGPKGEPMLFVRLQKTFYGMLKSTLLFSKKGLEINPYDPCVATKEIDGKQITICWHVYDLKISHKNKKQVDEIEEWLKSIYGNVTVSRGKKHTYLACS